VNRVYGASTSLKGFRARLDFLVQVSLAELSFRAEALSSCLFLQLVVSRPLFSLCAPCELPISIEAHLDPSFLCAPRTYLTDNVLNLWTLVLNCQLSQLDFGFVVEPFRLHQRFLGELGRSVPAMEPQSP
jgi:hypothetical protein